MEERGRTTVAIEDFYTIDQHDVLVDPQTGLPQAQWSIDANVRNKVDVLYDFNDPALRKEDFGRRQVWTADASVTKFGPQPALSIEARGIRSDLGGQDLMDQFALGFLQRWGYTPPMLRIAVTFRRHLFEILDSVRITHPLIKNPITGTLGLDRERFEVLEVTPAWLTEGKLILLLLWTGAIETSAAPTSGGVLNLVPGIGTIDATDIPVPLGGSASFTTAANTRKLTIDFKGLAFRTWDCVFSKQFFQPDEGGKGGGSCVNDTALSYVDRLYTSQLQYRVEYKTSAAPDSAGSGSDPSTGWVTLLPSTTRGAVALFNEKKCFGSPQAPAEPSEDAWSEHFEALGGSPATYNVKVFFEATVAQANPCGALPGSYCSTGGCTGGALQSSSIANEEAEMTIDAVTSLS